MSESYTPQVPVTQMQVIVELRIPFNPILRNLEND